jgi:hypothetical protein
MQQQRQDDIRKAIRVRKRDHSEVRALGRQSHGGDNPIGIRRDPCSIEKDPARNSGGSRRVLHQQGPVRRRGMQHRLGRLALDRDHRLPITPGPEDVHEKLRRPAAGDHRTLRFRRGGGPGGKVLEAPHLTCRSVEQGGLFVEAFRGFEPAGIEHLTRCVSLPS